MGLLLHWHQLPESLLAQSHCQDPAPGARPAQSMPPAAAAEKMGLDLQEKLLARCQAVMGAAWPVQIDAASPSAPLLLSIASAFQS